MSVALSCLALLLMLPYLLAAFGSWMRKRQLGRVDNQDPRQQALQLDKRGQRIYAAQQNSWEALVLFIAVIVIAYFSGLDPQLLDLPAVVYLLVRILHPLVYLLGQAYLRSALAAVGWLSCIYIVVLAFQQS
ncbi:MAPEG family protein [Agarivorans sp. QJM3NY_29]|uniref:MAPEG family protein n=1 Tax=unclassified Agarivorans TaxID=2636026 RepID=UPI003D7E9C02